MIKGHYRLNFSIVKVSSKVEEKTERCDPQSQIPGYEFMTSVGKRFPFSCHVDVDVGLDIIQKWVIYRLSKRAYSNVSSLIIGDHL
jgi:hypothetical protein